MSKIEEAAHRLEGAVTRLEEVARRLGAKSGEAQRLAGALAQTREDYAALEKTNSYVANRLDRTIEKLSAVLEN